MQGADPGARAQLRLRPERKELLLACRQVPGASASLSCALTHLAIC